MKWRVNTYAKSWSGATKTVVLTTDVAVRLTMTWSDIEPVRIMLPVIRRGVPIYCLPSWHWRNTHQLVQNEAGDTLTHTFTLGPWTDSECRWYFFTGTASGVPTESNTAFWKECYTAPLIPPPFTWSGPVYITLRVPILRPANKHVHFANGAYYAVLANTTQISVYKYDGVAVYRMNAAGEPALGGYTPTDIDSRLSHDASKLHIAIALRQGATTSWKVTYATFDIAGGTWSASETAQTVVGVGGLNPLAVISLDAANIPHIAYATYISGAIQTYYTNRLTGSWAAGVQAIGTIDGRYAWPGSACHDPVADAFAICASPSIVRTRFRTRSAAGVWSAITSITPNPSAFTAHSMIYHDSAYLLARMLGTNDLITNTGNPPTTQTGPWLNLANPMPQVSGLPDAVSPAYITYSKGAAAGGQRRRNPGGTFGTETAIPLVGVNTRSVNYADPAVLCAVLNKGAAADSELYAWDAPAT